MAKVIKTTFEEEQQANTGGFPETYAAGAACPCLQGATNDEKTGC